MPKKNILLRDCLSVYAPVWIVWIRNLRTFFFEVATRAESVHKAVNGPMFCPTYATLHVTKTRFHAI